MCGGDQLKSKDRNTSLESDRKSAKKSLEDWLRSHSVILKDPWEGSEWEDPAPLSDHPVVIDPTFGKENFYYECIQNKRFGSIFKITSFFYHLTSFFTSFAFDPLQGKFVSPNILA